MARPEYIPEVLYLITADGEQAINVALDEIEAISQADFRRQQSSGRHIRITRVEIADGDPLEIQREVIRQALVPDGSAVTE